jgi:hypothetical protein
MAVSFIVVVREFRSRNSPEFTPSILRHSGFLGEADEAVMNKVQNISGPKKIAVKNRFAQMPTFFACGCL